MENKLINISTDIVESIRTPQTKEKSMEDLQAKNEEVVLKVKRAKKRSMAEYMEFIELIKKGKEEGKSVWSICVEIAAAHPEFNPKTIMSKYYEYLKKGKINNGQSTNTTSNN